eukprot:578398-Amphidinium_carterae.1
MKLAMIMVPMVRACCETTELSLSQRSRLVPPDFFGLFQNVNTLPRACNVKVLSLYAFIDSSVGRTPQSDNV